ncbi:unnamed protein product [Prunus brigantina]
MVRTDGCEYSDLSIEEKLSAIVAPIDLLHAGSSFRMERLSATLSVNASTEKRQPRPAQAA